MGRESAYSEVANGPHWVLLDKTGVLEGAAFVGRHPDEDEQREELRRLVVWSGTTSPTSPPRSRVASGGGRTASWKRCAAPALA